MAGPCQLPLAVNELKRRYRRHPQSQRHGQAHTQDRKPTDKRREPKKLSRFIEK